jgi:hypothetical protein
MRCRVTLRGSRGDFVREHAGVKVDEAYLKHSWWLVLRNVEDGTLRVILPSESLLCWEKLPDEMEK